MNESYHECERNEHHSSCSKVPKNYSETTWALASIYYLNNARDTNYFTKKFTNCWCGQWLLVNEKVILIMGLDEN